jgi:hypothetical protein
MQAELDEQKRRENGEVTRIQDAAARALEQHKSEAPLSEVEAQALSNSPTLEPTTKTAEPCERDAEQRLPNGPQQAPAESGETGAVTSAAKSDQEKREDLMNVAQEAWGRGELEWKRRK